MVGRPLTIALLGILVGCYTLQPLGGVKSELGDRVAYDVNDAGRVFLGGTMGPEIAQIEGRLVEQDSAGVALSVSTVRLLRGGEQVWSGEIIRLRPEHMTTGFGRRFSGSRSLALGGVTVGGFAVLLLTRSLLAGGSGPGGDGGGDSVDIRVGRP